VAFVIAILLPVLLGFGALAVDVAQWYWERRNLQSAADAGAISGIYELYYRNATDAELRAAADAARNDIGANVTITAHSPPVGGPYAGDTQAVEVEISKPMELRLAQILGLEAVSATARATALMDVNDEFCILGLDPTMEGAVTIQGTADLTMNCGMAVNSRDDEALLVSGNPEIHVTGITMSGDMGANGNPVVDVTGAIRANHPPVEDPYAGLTVPSVGGACDHSNSRFNNAASLSPGTYCDGLELRAGATVDLAPGVYVIDGGDLKINGGATLTGDNVTIILTAQNESDYPNVTINGGATVELTAPTAGTYAGVVMFQDRNAPSFQGNTLIDNKMNGGADMDMQGVIYFPSQAVDFTGNSTLDPGCVKVIARQVIMSGTSAMRNDCPQTQYNPLGTPRARLVE
jgi:Flp pilus assembly protein TadG